MKRPISALLAIAIFGTSLAMARDTAGTPAETRFSQAPAPDRIRAYYGTALDGVTDINRMPPDAGLKSRLYEVLRQSHIAKPGHYDRLVESCRNTPLADGETCTERKALSYAEARREMFGRLYLSQSETSGEPRLWDVYCQTHLTAGDAGGVGPGSIPDHTKINTEHTWPQSRFNANEHRETQRTDLHHIFPTDSERNRIRSNYEFGEVDPARARKLESQRCAESSVGPVLVPYGIPVNNPNQVRFEVPQAHKGNVARALMYFSVRYRAAMSPVEEYYMRMWHEQDPVTPEDRRLNDEIESLQGNRNPFIDYPELVDLIPDFGASESQRGGEGRGEEEGRANQDAPPPPRQQDRSQEPSGTTGASTPAEASAHSFIDGVFTVLGADGRPAVTRQGIVAVCRHESFGVPNASHSSYEYFALDAAGTLHKIRGGRRLGNVQTEPARDSRDLAATMSAMRLTCSMIEAK